MLVTTKNKNLKRILKCEYVKDENVQRNVRVSEKIR